MQIPVARAVLVVPLLALAAEVCLAGAPVVVPDDLTVRARVTRLTPAEPTDIAWRWGGEGLGGEVRRGTLGHELAVGEWSPAVPLRSFAKGRFPGPFFLTLTAGRRGRGGRGGAPGEGYSTGLEMELEFAWGGRVLKRLVEQGPDGGTVGVVIPTGRLAGGRTPDDPAFLDGLVGLLEYARRRKAALEALPWADRPVPEKLAVVTDVGGYGVDAGYGVRHTDKRIVEIECRALRQLGVNGLRSAPEYLIAMAARREGCAAGLGRAAIVRSAGYPVPVFRKGRQNDPEAGCPFGEGVQARTAEAVVAALEAMRASRLPEVWGLTVDEIGTVIDRSAEGKSHFARCPRCQDVFRAYLKERGLAPADFGRPAWDEILPLDLAAKDGLPFDPADPKACLAAYWTRMFNNWASARLFTPLRDTCRASNEAKRRALAEGRADAPEAARPWLYSYALRGNTFLMKGHSLDFFDFYRLADNAFVYETSNRGPQIWSWDSYLCDVGRVVSGRMDLAFGVYVKPHRGAGVQRALSAAARGARMIYWYTYGPDYKKGDSFSQNPADLVLVSKAARILAAAEDVLYGGTPAAPAEVALVKPRTSEIWMAWTGDPAFTAAWEDTKWTYTALAHAHVPVDPLDETMLAAEDLSRYKVIYVLGPNVTRVAAAALARWVRAGGTLVTHAGGLVRDEAQRPLEILGRVLGLTGRTPPEMYRNVKLYGAGGVQSFDDRRDVLAPVPPGADVRPEAAGGPAGAGLRPVVGREVLRPAEGTAVVARFADGAAAVTRHRHGRGEAWVAGFFPGLEYSARVRAEGFDMTRDFDPRLRAWAAGPALERVQPVVEPSLPTVEGILIRHSETGRRAVILMNWAYASGLPAGSAGTDTASGMEARATARRRSGVRHVPATDLKIALCGVGPVRTARSAWLQRPLAVERGEGGAVAITVPYLAEGDVLLLE
jgi:hypothetical protein